MGKTAKTAGYFSAAQAAAERSGCLCWRGQAAAKAGAFPRARRRQRRAGKPRRQRRAAKGCPL